ncbi:MAG: M48 family peptidase [Spirulina sp. DLM2.Bin59]|nr:MAG: M48 family peptidase [Spirulina sp. DLM2.Bin59]
MKNKFFTHPPRWVYGLIAALTTCTIFFAQPVQAISIWDIIRGGAQVLQGIQLGNMSPDREMSLGGQIDSEIKQQLARKETPVVPANHVASQYISAMGQRMVEQLTPAERRDINFTFQVVNDPSINAFATMGGYVYINAGLMLLADTEAELAGVVGHEMAHIIERHAIRQMRERAIQQGILSAAGLHQTQVIHLGVEVALNLPNSRGDENDADTLGLSIMRRVGYHPQGMVNFMTKLARQRGGQGMTILSTHPNPGDRVNSIARQIAQNPPTDTEMGGMDPQAYCLQMRRVVNSQVQCS